MRYIPSAMPQYKLVHSSLFWENRVCELRVSMEEENMKTRSKTSQTLHVSLLGLSHPGSKPIDFASHFGLSWQKTQGTEWS